ncbi:MAG: hypothetical protein PPP58_10505 [Natronomonas sp.]
MKFHERYRHELMALLIITAVVVGALEGFLFGGVDGPGLVGVLFTVALVTVGILRVVPVAEAMFVLESTVVSMTTPLLLEGTLRFELIGVAIASAFVVGVVLNRFVERTEPTPRRRRR